MPNLQSQAQLFRTSNYHYTGYLGTISETVVLRGTISATPTFPAKQVSYTGISGSFSNVKVDQDVVVFVGATAVERGRLRVADGAATSSVLQINEVSAGTVNITSGDVFEVVEVWRIHDKLVAANAQFNKDSRIPYTDQGSNPPPVANGGGPWFGFVDFGQAYATVAFDGSTSFRTDPDAGSLTYSWNIGDGTLVSGSLTSATLTATFPVGFRHVSLTVTDSGSGKSTMQYIPLRVYARTGEQPLHVQMDDLGGTTEQGWQASFRLPVGAEASLSNLPDGALVVYFEDEHYGGLKASYGSNAPGRSHIKFVGYLVRESIEIDPETDEVSFEALGPLGILELTPALPQLVRSKTAPANWQQIKTLTINRALHYLFHWHASAGALHDFLWPDGTDLSYSALTVENLDNLAGQLRDIASSIGVQLTCDRLGRLIFMRDPHLLSEADRAARTKTYDLATADVMRVSTAFEHRLTGAKMVEGRAFINTTRKTAYSRAPGNAPAEAIPSVVLDRQIVASQAALNERTGFYFARVNSLYNGKPVPKGTTLLLHDSYDIFDPAYREFLTFTLPASTNKRGRSFDNTTRWTVEGVSISYDPDIGAKEITLTLDHEAKGVAGVKYTPPQFANNGLPAFPPLNLEFGGLGEFGIPTSAPTLGKGTGRIAAILIESGAAAKFAITEDFHTPASAGGPTWIASGAWGIGAGETIHSFVVDAFSPLYLGTGSQVNGWLATDDKIYRVTDLFGSFGLTLRHTFASANADSAFIQSGRAFQNAVACAIFYDVAGNSRLVYTSDDVTWTEIAVTSGFAGDSNNAWAFVSEKSAGRTYMGGFTASNAGDLYISTSYGGSPVVASAGNPPDVDVGTSSCIGHVPFHDNPNEKLIYYGKRIAESDGRRFMRTELDGTTITDITGVAGGQHYQPLNPRSISTCPIDRRRAVYTGIPNNLPRRRTVFRSYNGGGAASSDWEAILGLQSSLSSGEGVSGLEIAGDNPDVVYLWGTALDNGNAPAIWYSSDFLTSHDERTGNLAALSSGRVLSLVGG